MECQTPEIEHLGLEKKACVEGVDCDIDLYSIFWLLRGPHAKNKQAHAPTFCHLIEPISGHLIFYRLIGVHCAAKIHFNSFISRPHKQT